jgi:1-acyl-sn-glycerol-3-phosphate acyltransferase
VIVLPADWLCSILITGRLGDRRARARLLCRWARRIVRLVGCEVEVRGTPPDRGLCVSNHVSYLDIPVFGSLAPMLFVAKREVIFWPVFGQWAAMCGTLFIQRERKGHVADVGRQMAPVLAAGVPLVVFPEGTSSDGSTVLPFKSSLFQPAVEHGWPVTPMHIGYEVGEGSVAEDVAYWRDMTLVPHLWRLLGLRRIRARLTFGEAIPAGTQRKEVCRRAHQAVLELADAPGRTGPVATSD